MTWSQSSSDMRNRLSGNSGVVLNIQPAIFFNGFIHHLLRIGKEATLPVTAGLYTFFLRAAVVSCTSGKIVKTTGAAAQRRQATVSPSRAAPVTKATSTISYY